ncbi:MAG TPA: hypothetical protein PLO37_14000 [Candidatus Hydrogenedentes bacterium]|nr:hypothetical protein [Candidatus Hydrogenedentota bacterium]HPG67957.1 hypothetical protein [Candidatus Hydrogenedentota bacterium]
MKSAIMAALLFAAYGGVDSMNVHADEAIPEGYPSVKEFPDPFRFDDGTRVASVKDWPRRRDEMKECILAIEYGHVPPPPGNVEVAREDAPEVTNEGRTFSQRVVLRFGPDKALETNVCVYRPNDKTGPFPTIVRIGPGDDMASEMNERGYAFVAFEHRDLDPDTEGHDVVGPAQQAYPDNDWASLGVWAWGASRVVDYLETCPWANTAQLVITGHSRTGKTALLAGALDERFAMVVPNGSGCGGSGAFRVMGTGAETLDLITRPERFASWFHKDFHRFARREDRLPFDQHFLKALVAPRMLLTTDALGDYWANPLGTQATFLAVQPVFDFLGASDHSAIHFRKGGHDQLPEDFRALLDFADWYFSERPLPRPRVILADPGYRLSVSWNAPKPGS